MQKHQIKTLSDIVRVTNPNNIDAFLEDFKKIIALIHRTMPLENSEITFEWNDNCKNEFSLELFQQIGVKDYFIKTKEPILTSITSHNKEKSVEQFEYRVIDHDVFEYEEINTMNYMGSKGWEIIRILDPMKWKDSDGYFIRIYYKRQKIESRQIEQNNA